LIRFLAVVWCCHKWDSTTITTQKLVLKIAEQALFRISYTGKPHVKEKAKKISSYWNSSVSKAIYQMKGRAQ